MRTLICMSIALLPLSTLSRAYRNSTAKHHQVQKLISYFYELYCLFTVQCYRRDLVVGSELAARSHCKCFHKKTIETYSLSYFVDNTGVCCTANCLRLSCLVIQENHLERCCTATVIVKFIFCRHGQPTKTYMRIDL